MRNAFSAVTMAVLLLSWNHEEGGRGQVEKTDFAALRSQELRCIIGNNTARGNHRKGYNGVFELTSVHQAENLFVPQYSGLNLEHVFDGSARTRDRQVFFEPRMAPMSFKLIDERTASLHQPALPTWKVESTTTFRLVDPYYLDVSFVCEPTLDLFEGGALGLFWANYINAPLDKSIYFLTGPEENRTWQQFCTQYHTRDSTVKSQDDDFVWAFNQDAPKALYQEVSDVRWAEPFFYGRFRNMVFILIFDPLPFRWRTDFSRGRYQSGLGFPMGHPELRSGQGVQFQLSCRIQGVGRAGRRSEGS
jgi:hypothetical protein